MKKLVQHKNLIIVILIICLLIFKGVFINIISNINLLVTKPSNKYISEINILKDNIKELEKNLSDLGDTISIKEYNYTLSKMSYRKSYDSNTFYITGGKDLNYQKNYALANENGLIGIITKTYKDYSECKTLKAINNLTVVINDTYGTLSSYEEDLFVITNISNYDKVSLNDKVYTSSSGIIKEQIYIGYVYKIERKEYEKIIYLKSDVDFNNINYLHVIGGK